MVILIGNVTVTAFWKVFADRTGSAPIVAFGQRLVTITEFSFTLGGIALIVIGGYGAVYAGRLDVIETPWLVWGQGLFALSGLIWLGLLVPLQVRQAAQARSFRDGVVPPAYRRDARLWLWAGIVATVPLVAAIVVMVAKPG